MRIIPQPYRQEVIKVKEAKPGMKYNDCIIVSVKFNNVYPSEVTLVTPHEKYDFGREDLILVTIDES